MKTTTLGELGTEQFRIATSIDGRTIADQPIHDPFITNETVIGLKRWDLFKALFKRQFEVRVRVRVSATAGALRAVMTLDPIQLQKDTDQILEQARISREQYKGMGFATSDSWSSVVASKSVEGEMP